MPQWWSWYTHSVQGGTSKDMRVRSSPAAPFDTGAWLCYHAVMPTKKKTTDQLFQEFDDPNYWDEEEGDRRKALGVILSYDDVKTLARVVPWPISGSVLRPLLENMESWSNEVNSILK